MISRNITISWFSSLCTMVAILMSWSVNHSVWWAILHSIVSFIYVPYWLVKYTSLVDWISQWVVS